MLNDSHIRQINRMIDDELRKARYASHTDRKQYLDRVAELQALLPSEKPSRQDMLKELAQAIVDATNERPSQPTSLIEAIFGTCR